VSETAEPYTIGGAARRVGVPARTIRFWCDSGVLPPAERSAGGYRRFDAAAIARLDLVRTLRDLGLGLDDIREVLGGRRSVAELADVHVAALDAQIRVLRVRRAVLRVLAARSSSPEEAKLMNDLARLSAQERRQIIDEFVDATFAGVAPDDPATGIARGMRALPAELPDDPSAEQVDAWLELAGLVADEGFQARAREMVLAGGTAQSLPEVDYRVITEDLARAVADGIDPASAAGKAVRSWPVLAVAGGLAAGYAISRAGRPRPSYSPSVQYVPVHTANGASHARGRNMLAAIAGIAATALRIGASSEARTFFNAVKRFRSRHHGH